MKNETLKQIINQIKKYNLTESFSGVEQFKDWASKLNSTQINNFLSLDINLEGIDIDLKEIKNLKHLLINSDLLNCKDYTQRVEAISTLKDVDGFWHLLDVSCKPNFLKSQNFYKDIEMLGKADSTRHGLWILGEDVFIKSPYHDEDLKLIVDTHDTNQEISADYDDIVSGALAEVANNIDSIKSPYHQADMRLISTVGSGCLQPYYSLPERSLNKLAVNKVSLSDKYHLKNMEILATNPIASEFLYIIMTNPEIIKGEYYRKEIEALLNAKSKHTARALYYYIVNPRKKFDSDYHFHDDYRYDIEDAHIEYSKCVSGKVDPDYINNLIKINQIDDKFVMHYVSLLMNPNFINSPYKKFDLELLQNVSCKPIFMDLYELMSNEYSLNHKYHKKDAVIISQTEENDLRDLLLSAAVNEYSLESNNHEYDMEYILSLKGMDDSQRREKLEEKFKKRLQEILVEKSTDLSNYLDSLQTQIENSKSYSQQIIESVPNSSYKKGPKILSSIKKYIKKQR